MSKRMSVEREPPAVLATAGVEREPLRIHPNLQEVEQAGALQRRLYRTVRETMRAMAGRLCGVARWEAKQLLARHGWIDAEHGDLLRKRVLELRFLPRIESICARMPPPAHPERFRPLGSSAATTSYAAPAGEPARP